MIFFFCLVPASLHLIIIWFLRIKQYKTNIIILKKNTIFLFFHLPAWFIRVNNNNNNDYYLFIEKQITILPYFNRKHSKNFLLGFVFVLVIKSKKERKKKFWNGYVSRFRIFPGRIFLENFFCNHINGIISYHYY